MKREPRAARALRPAPALAEGPPEEVGDRLQSVFLRRLIFSLVVTIAMGIAVISTDSPDVLAVLPYFFVAITLQFLPLFWPSRVDPFAPVALPVFIYSPEIIAEALRCIRSGDVEIAYLTELTATTKVELLQKVLILWIVSSLAHFAGFYLGTGRKRIARLFPRVGEMVWKPLPLAIACTVCMVAFVLAYAAFQSRMTSSVTDVTALSDGKAVLREDPSISWMGRSVLLGFVPLLFLTASVSARPTFGRVVFTVVASVVMALLAIRLGQRGYGLYFALSCVIIIHNVYKRFRLTVLVGMTFAALVALNVMGEWRTPDEEKARTPLVARVLAPDKVLTAYASDRNRISILATVFHYIPDRQDYLMGESYVALLAAPIPKWIWADKRDYQKWSDAGIAVQLRGIPGPTPMNGVLYANFSWVGVVIGMFLWGLFQRGMYEWLLEGRNDKNRALLYSAMVLYIAPSTLALAHAFQYVLPLWLIIKYCGRRVSQSAVEERLPVRARAQAA